MLFSSVFLPIAGNPLEKVLEMTRKREAKAIEGKEKFSIQRNNNSLKW